MEHDMEHDMEPPSHYSFIAHYSINVSLLARIKVPKGYLLYMGPFDFRSDTCKKGLLSSEGKRCSNESFQKQIDSAPRPVALLWPLHHAY